MHGYPQNLGLFRHLESIFLGVEFSNDSATSNWGFPIGLFYIADFRCSAAGQAASSALAPFSQIPHPGLVRSVYCVHYGCEVPDASGYSNDIGDQEIVWVTGWKDNFSNETRWATRPLNSRSARCLGLGRGHAMKCT